MLKPRKVPLRKCVATNEQHPKMDMFRIVRTPEGNIIIDLTGKARGRGAYLSKSKTAINRIDMVLNPCFIIILSLLD